MLPPIQQKKRERMNFPQAWQAVIFRNYGFVKTEKIAKTLCCNKEIIEKEALRLGLQNVVYNPKWEECGYITIIRNNWGLLSYEQLLTLLDITKERLEYILVNDDFLSIKLGGYKPACARVFYAPLTDKEIQKTELLADIVRANRIPNIVQPFAFFETKSSGNFEIKSANGKRIVHGYLSPCGDPFIEDSIEYLPDFLLQEYARTGVNGLWFHGILATLSPYPLDEQASENYALRRKNLKKLIARCEKYGIKIYLYLNEPRGLAEEKFGKYAYLMGRRQAGFAALCLEKKETQQYLYEAVKDLLLDISGLGGIITITMSENLTHCNFRPNTNCPICRNIPAEESAAKVNNIIMRAVRDSGNNAEVIASLWSWSPYMEWTMGQVLHGVELLDKDISVLGVSEYGQPFEIGGVKGEVIDYSIGNIGPSPITVAALKKARENGHRIYAKVQVNNSWECSAPPYIPVYDLFYQHFQNLNAMGVRDYMLTWTLGGYPSPVFDLSADYAEQGDAFDLDNWYQRQYGEQGDKVHQAVKEFCVGIKKYPFSIDSLYFSPKTLGPALLWDWQQEEKISTMVCYAYDDYETWIKPYPYEVYVSQYEKLLSAWEKGLNGLKALSETEKLRELKICAQTAYIHFKSDLLQTKFSYYKRNKARYEKEFTNIFREETEIVKSLLSIIAESSYVGYETSNHYFYNERNLLEKLLNIYNLGQENK